MTGASIGSWRVLAEWPACIFSGTGFSERCNHSLTWRDGTSQFWVFGGRGADGALLNDVSLFDMEEEQFNTPQTLNEPPAPRECHSSCFVADRYLVCYGGYDVDGKLHTTAAVYDVVTRPPVFLEALDERVKEDGAPEHNNCAHHPRRHAVLVVALAFALH